MRFFAILVLLSVACSIPLSIPGGAVGINSTVVTEKIGVVESAPTPPTVDMTVVGSLRLRSAPDNTGSRTMAVIPKGEKFHVQRRTTVKSTEWAYGSWYNPERETWIVGYVAARFLR